MGLQFKWFTRTELNSISLDCCMTRADNSRIMSDVRCPWTFCMALGCLFDPTCFLRYMLGYVWIYTIALLFCELGQHASWMNTNYRIVLPQSHDGTPPQHVSKFWQVAAWNWQLFQMHQFVNKPQPWNLDQVQVDYTVDPAKTDMFSLEMVLEQNKISMHLGSQHVASCLWQMKAWKLRVVLGSSWVVKYRTT